MPNTPRQLGQPPALVLVSYPSIAHGIAHTRPRHPGFIDRVLDEIVIRYGRVANESRLWRIKLYKEGTSLPRGIAEWKRRFLQVIEMPSRTQGGSRGARTHMMDQMRLCAAGFIAQHPSPSRSVVFLVESAMLTSPEGLELLRYLREEHIQTIALLLEKPSRELLDHVDEAISLDAYFEEDILRVHRSSGTSDYSVSGPPPKEATAFDALADEDPETCELIADLVSVATDQPPEHQTGKKYISQEEYISRVREKFLEAIKAEHRPLPALLIAVLYILRSRTRFPDQTLPRRLIETTLRQKNVPISRIAFAIRLLYEEGSLRKNEIQPLIYFYSHDARNPVYALARDLWDEFLERQPSFKVARILSALEHATYAEKEDLEPEVIEDIREYYQLQTFPEEHRLAIYKRWGLDTQAAKNFEKKAIEILTGNPDEEETDENPSLRRAS
jgi:hypothetical protein